MEESVKKKIDQKLERFMVNELKKFGFTKERAIEITEIHVAQRKNPTIMNDNKTLSLFINQALMRKKVTKEVLG